MGYVDPQSIFNPTAGGILPAAWCDQVRDDLEWNNTVRPRVYAYATGAQSIPNNTWTALSLTGESEDVGPLHSTSSNTGRITIPAGAAGLYWFKGMVLFTASAAGSTRQARAMASTGLLVDLDARGASSAYVGICKVMGLIRLLASEWIELQAFQDTGGSLNTDVAQMASHLSAVWLAP